MEKYQKFIDLHSQGITYIRITFYPSKRLSPNLDIKFLNPKTQHISSCILPLLSRIHSSFSHIHHIHHIQISRSSTTWLFSGKTQLPSYTTMTTIFDAVKERNGTPRDAECYIQRLPVELICAIAKELPLDSRLVFSQTCSWFRNIISGTKTLRCSRTSLDFYQIEEFLFAISRDIPDKWACFNCQKLHPVNALDTPSNRKHSVCVWAREGLHGRESRSWPQFRHVVLPLTLICSGGLSEDQRDYVRQLFQSHSGSLPLIDPYQPRVDGLTHAAQPRIVNGTHLMKYTWSLNGPLRNMPMYSRGSRGSLDICRHQSIQGYLIRRLPLRGLRGREPLPAVLEHGEIRALQRCFIRAYNGTAGQRFEGACPSCATDFVVRFEGAIAEVLVWCSLGSDNADYPRSISDRFGNSSGYAIPGSHRPGSIRALYERT